MCTKQIEIRLLSIPVHRSSVATRVMSTGVAHRVLDAQQLNLVVVEGVVVDAVGQADELVRRVVERPVVDPAQQANQDASELQVEALHVLRERVRGLHC